MFDDESSSSENEENEDNKSDNDEDNQAIYLRKEEYKSLLKRMNDLTNRLDLAEGKLAENIEEYEHEGILRLFNLK